MIEFDNVSHREIIKSTKFLSLLVAELVSHKRLEAVENKIATRVAQVSVYARACVCVCVCVCLCVVGCCVAHIRVWRL